MSWGDFAKYDFANLLQIFANLSNLANLLKNTYFRIVLISLSGNGEDNFAK